MTLKISSITLQDGTTIRVGDTVAAHNYRSMGIPARLGRSGTQHVVTGIFQRYSDNPKRGYYLQIQGAGSKQFGYEWFAGFGKDAEIAELKDVLNRERAAADEVAHSLREQLQQRASEVEQAEATARRLSQVLSYAESIMGARKRGMLEGYAKGLDARR